MKLLHTESSRGWGGQEIRVIDEACGMLSRGHTVTLAVPAGSRIALEAAGRGVDVRTLPIEAKRPSGLIALRRLLRDLKPDVLNTHSSTDSWLAALAIATLRESPPLVRTRHISATIPANAASRWLYRRAAAHVVTTGEALRAQVLRETGLAPGRVTSVPTGIDLGRFQPGDRTAARRRLGLREDVFLAGIVATLRSWKGHRYLIEAVSMIQDENVHLAIVGDGPGREPVARQVAALGLQRRVYLAGEQRDVVPWLQSLDLFVLPSYANEGVPQAIMQAMACGLPVLSTDVGAIREAVCPGHTGEFAPTRDAPALAEAIDKLRGVPERLREMGEAGRQVAERRFARDRMLDDMERVFETVRRARETRAATAWRSRA